MRTPLNIATAHGQTCYPGKGFHIEALRSVIVHGKNTREGYRYDYRTTQNKEVTQRKKHDR